VQIDTRWNVWSLAWCINWRVNCIFLYRRSVTMRFSPAITQFWSTTATNSIEVTNYVNANNVVGHEGARNILFQCIVSIMWVFIIFLRGYVRCNMLYKEEVLWLFELFICWRWL
jgi:hypothetical protein